MITPDEIQKSAIELLHFHPKWFLYGLLPLEFFEQQVRKYQKVLQYQEQNNEFGGNPDAQVDADSIWASLEHHRYAAFTAFLVSHQDLSDEQVKQYVELCELDEDQFMATSALIRLLTHKNLSPSQRHYLWNHPTCQTPIVQPFAEKLR